MNWKQTRLYSCKHTHCICIVVYILYVYLDSPHVGRQSLRHRPPARQGTPRSKTWRTEGNTQRKRSDRVTLDLKRACSAFSDQFEHPWAAAARRKAAEQPKNNDGGSSPDEDIWCVGALLRRQGEIGLQVHLAPHPDSQQDHACYLRRRQQRESVSQSREQVQQVHLSNTTAED